MDSIAQLYSELRTPVFRFLCHMGCDPASAEELTQETFLQALLSVGRFRGDSSVRTWLFSIARNQFLKSLRRERRQHQISQRQDPPPSLPEPAEVAAAREQAAWLRAALDRLPELSRTVLVLREYEGLSHAEVAAIVGRSEVWCRVACFRAREQLKAHYLQISGGKMDEA